MEGPIHEMREINFLTRIQIGIVIAIILMIISSLVKIERFKALLQEINRVF